MIESPGLILNSSRSDAGRVICPLLVTFADAPIRPLMIPVTPVVHRPNCLTFYDTPYIWHELGELQLSHDLLIEADDKSLTAIRHQRHAARLPRLETDGGARRDVEARAAGALAIE